MPTPHGLEQARQHNLEEPTTIQPAAVRTAADVGGTATRAHRLSPRLEVVTTDPLNAETNLARHREVLTPTAAHYIRNHFTVPRIDRSVWRLRIGGDVLRPAELTFDDLLALPARTLSVTLECAGNGRSALRPQPEGEPWRYGAVSTARWTGVALRDVLLAADLASSASEVVVAGADHGYVAEASRELSFARSLPREQALHPDTLLAYAMNGKALTVEHGFPVRLIVPGWYGVASVKWVMRIEALARSFDGYYQTERYVLLSGVAGQSTGAPLTRTAIRSVISVPEADATLGRGMHLVRGFAWSGCAPITRVEVSVDGGSTWVVARLTSPVERYAWRRWVLRWHADVPGPSTLMCRAYDALGNEQPEEAHWNRLGYANNAVYAVRVHVT